MVTPRPRYASGAPSRTGVGRIEVAGAGAAGRARAGSRAAVVKRRGAVAAQPLRRRPARRVGAATRTTSAPSAAGVAVRARHLAPAEGAGQRARASGPRRIRLRAGADRGESRAHVGRRARAGRGDRQTTRSAIIRASEVRMDLGGHPEGARRAAASTAGCSTTSAAATRSRAA